MNSPKLTVIAGDIDAILRFNEEFEKRGIFNRLVRVDSAFHSHHMEPVKDELLSELSFLTPSSMVKQASSATTSSLRNITAFRTTPFGCNSSCDFLKSNHSFSVEDGNFCCPHHELCNFARDF